MVTRWGKIRLPQSQAEFISLWTHGSITEESNSKNPSVTSDIPKELDDNLSFEERIKKGDYYLSKGFNTFAANEYVKAIKLAPKLPLGYFKLAQADFASSDFKKANGNCDEAIKLKPDYPDAYLLKARIAMREGHFDEAQKLFNSPVLSSQDQASIFYLKALLFLSTDQYDEAKKILLTLKNDPSFNQKEKVENLLSAYTEFQFAEASQTIFLDELIARSFNQIGEYELAISKIKNILRNRSDLRDSWILLGYAYLNLNNYPFALAAFDRAYQLDSTWPTTPYYIGLTYFEMGNFKEALAYFEMAKSNHFEPSNTVLNSLAEVYIELQDYSNAAEIYGQLIEKNPQDINSYVKPVWINIDFLKQPQKALEYAETAVQLFPNEALAYNLRGWSYLNLSKLDEAEADLKRSLSLNPGLPAVYLNLGLLYENREDPIQAKKAFKKAYELDPGGSIGAKAAEHYNQLTSS